MTLSNLLVGVHYWHIILTAYCESSEYFVIVERTKGVKWQARVSCSEAPVSDQSGANVSLLTSTWESSAGAWYQTNRKSHWVCFSNVSMYNVSSCKVVLYRTSSIYTCRYSKGQGHGLTKLYKNVRAEWRKGHSLTKLYQNVRAEWRKALLSNLVFLSKKKLKGIFPYIGYMHDQLVN